MGVVPFFSRAVDEIQLASVDDHQSAEGLHLSRLDDSLDICPKVRGAH